MARRGLQGAIIEAVSPGSRPYSVPDRPPAGYLLVGDSASVPAIRGMLAAIPADVPVEAYLEQHHEDDPLLPLGDHPRATIHWVARENVESLSWAIPDRDWSDWFAWVGTVAVAPLVDPRGPARVAAGATVFLGLLIGNAP